MAAPKKQPYKPKKGGGKAPGAKAVNAISELAAAILAECSFRTAIGMDREAATDSKKRPYAMEEAARGFWLKKHMKTIPAALTDPNNNWDVDRQFVLPQAEELGKIAMSNALADPINNGTAGITVTKAHVKAASKTISTGRICTAARTGRLGSGPYCPEIPE
jgi:hypothetical protein